MQDPSNEFINELSTFSCISEVDCASQKATVATSFSIGISTEQSRPSSSAISGRGCIGPLGMGPRIDTEIKQYSCILANQVHQHLVRFDGLRETTCAGFMRETNDVIGCCHPKLKTAIKVFIQWYSK